jgi:hypothetical protein
LVFGFFYFWIASPQAARNDRRECFLVVLLFLFLQWRKGDLHNEMYGLPRALLRKLIIQLRVNGGVFLDCFVVTLLAMTEEGGEFPRFFAMAHDDKKEDCCAALCPTMMKYNILPRFASLSY